MAQKVVGFIKLQIPAGKATPAPPVGPALGQHGVNIMAFTKEFNERTKSAARALHVGYSMTLRDGISKTGGGFSLSAARACGNFMKNADL